MKPLRALMALSLLLDATGAAANAAARAAARVRAPAAPVVTVAPLGALRMELDAATFATGFSPRVAMVSGSPAADAPRAALSPALPASAVGLAPADAPRAPIADRGWLGDYEDVLLNGTEQQQEEVEALMAAGRISPEHPGTEAERRALGIIRGVTNDWTPRLFDAAVKNGTPGQAPLSWETRMMLKRSDGDLAQAQARASGPLESLVLGARRALGRVGVPKEDEGLVSWLKDVSRRSFGGRRAVAEGLAARIPGADARHAILGDERFRHYGSGWLGFASVNTVDDEGRPKSMVWAARRRASDLYHALAHEFTHQGDTGYMAGETALRLLVRDAAPRLATALIEGYTEARARRTLDALRAEGVAGVRGLPARYLRALRARHGGDDETAWQRELATRGTHPYEPYVRMIAAIEARPGGREALEGFVKRGEARPLVAVLGEQRLRDLAIALAPPPATRGAATAEAYAALGFHYLFMKKLPDIASGKLDADAFRRLKGDAVTLSEHAARKLRSQPGREDKLDRLFATSIARDLAGGEPLERLEARVDAAVKDRLLDRFPRLKPSSIVALSQQVIVPVGAAALALALGQPWWVVPLAAFAGYELGDLWNAATVVVAPDARVPVLLERGRRELKDEPSSDTARALFGWGRPKTPAPRPRLTANWSEQQARDFVDAVVAAFAPRLAAAGYEVMPMVIWDDPELDARVRFDGMFHNLIVSRGFFKTRGLTADAAAHAMTHEIGHLLGAGPQDPRMRTGGEGEADYFGAGEGWTTLEVSGALGPEPAGLRRSREYAAATAWLKARGAATPGRARALAAALVLRAALGKSSVSLWSPDPAVVPATLEDYPSDQARLDTMAAAIIGAPRPRSWAHPDQYGGRL